MTRSSSAKAGRPGRRILIIFGLLAPALLLRALDGQPDWADPLLSGLGAALAMQLGTLYQITVGRLAGLTPLQLMVGFGPRLVGWRIGRLPMSLRWVPLPIVSAALVLAERRAQRLRLWVSTLALLCLQIGVAGWLMTFDGPLLWGMSFGILIMPVVGLTFGVRIPLAAGWVLFRLPFKADGLQGMVVTPAELVATRALQDGRLGAAREALRDSGDGFQARLLRATVGIGEGRYTEAAAETQEAASLAPHPRSAGIAYYLRASALVGAADTGLLPSTDYLPWLTQTEAAARVGQPMQARCFPVAADLARLEGRYEDAAALARAVLRQGHGGFWLAQAECSYAAALTALGRPDEARAALGRARRAMPELARITTVAESAGLGGIDPVTAGR